MARSTAQSECWELSTGTKISRYTATPGFGRTGTHHYSRRARWLPPGSVLLISTRGGGGVRRNPASGLLWSSGYGPRLKKCQSDYAGGGTRASPGAPPTPLGTPRHTPAAPHAPPPTPPPP